MQRLNFRNLSENLLEDFARPLIVEYKPNFAVLYSESILVSRLRALKSGIFDVINVVKLEII